jgi:hypothetical protein
MTDGMGGGADGHACSGFPDGYLAVHLIGLGDPGRSGHWPGSCRSP